MNLTQHQKKIKVLTAIMEFEKWRFERKTKKTIFDYVCLSISYRAYIENISYLSKPIP
jgi:hypothetical protein